jgi:hypothetical protein
MEAAFVLSAGVLARRNDGSSRRASSPSIRAQAGPPASPPPPGGSDSDNPAGSDVMAARVTFERALQLDLDASSGKNGRCTCIWCNGSGQRSCAWCGGHGTRNELESQSWDEISKNIGKKMNGEAVEMPERIPVRQFALIVACN